MPIKHIDIEVSHPQVEVLREVVKKTIKADTTDELIALICQKAVGNFVKKIIESKEE